MRTTAGRLTWTCLCLLVLVAGLASPIEAGVIPWVYDAIFGPVRAPHAYSYGAYYAPAYSYYAPAASYYPPSVSYYSPAIVPGSCGPGGCGIASGPFVPSCGPCRVAACPPRITFCPSPFAPCGPLCSVCDSVGCPTGDCSVATPAPAASSAKPAPKTEPKTFSDEPKVPTPVDEGFRPRAADSKGTEPTQTEAFKVPETVIPQRQPAPAKVPAEEGQPASKPGEAQTPKLPDPTNPTDQSDPTGNKTNTQPAKPKAAEPKPAEPKPAEPKAAEPKPSEAGLLPVPQLKFDEKVTWRVVPARTRLTLHARFVTPTVARTPTDPNVDWMTRPTGPQIVQK